MSEVVTRLERAKDLSPATSRRGTGDSAVTLGVVSRTVSGTVHGRLSHCARKRHTMNLSGKGLVDAATGHHRQGWIMRGIHRPRGLHLLGETAGRLLVTEGGSSPLVVRVRCNPHDGDLAGSVGQSGAAASRASGSLPQAGILRRQRRKSPVDRWRFARVGAPMNAAVAT